MTYDAEVLKTKLQGHVTHLQALQSDIESGAIPDEQFGNVLADVIERIVGDIPEMAPVVHAILESVHPQ